MGLQIVEVIMRVEETFDIEIPDEDACELNTVGKLYESIVQKLGLNHGGRCLSSASFYRLRRALINSYGVSRRQVTPTAAMAELLPAGERRKHWKNLVEQTGVRLPELVAPNWALYAVAGTCGACWVTALAYLHQAPVLAAVYFIGSFCFLWMVGRVTPSLKVCLPADCATVGGVVKAMVRLNDGVSVEKPTQWQREEVWDTLRTVLADEWAVPIERITVEADFVRDLDMD